MNITATTPDEDILAGVEYAHERIVAAASIDVANFNSEPLAKLVNELAEAEGIAQARATYRDLLANGASQETIIRSMLRLVARGADDTWSGRANDVRRCRFDGIRLGCSAILDSLGIYV